ncbi:MAG: LCP family protein [Actinobacteria bacterium]|nr:LCP family protein [Actinomycetota bacterium]
MTQQQPPAPAPPKRRISLVKKLFLTFLVVSIAAVFGALGFIWWADSKIEKIPAEELVSLQPVAPDEARTILLVGSDSRDGLPPEWEDNFGDFSGKRTDVIMIAQITPDGEGQLISLPRDLRVTIPGKGINKINAAFVFGGPDLLIQTIQENFGISINNYIEINFGGFGKVVDSLGGIEITFDNPARDAKSGLRVEEGKQRLDGEMALAYARSRFYQELRNGKWVSVRGSDIGRTGRQQEVLMTMFRQAKSPGSAFNLPGFIGTFAEQITADEGITPGVLLELGKAGLALDVENIDMRTLPVEISNQNGTSYVIPVEPEASALLAAFRAGVPFPPEE